MGVTSKHSKTIVARYRTRWCIHSCSVARICNEKPDIYGTTNSALRRQVQNKVAYWRSLHPAKFETLKREKLGLVASPSLSSVQSSSQLQDNGNDDDSLSTIVKHNRVAPSFAQTPPQKQVFTPQKSAASLHPAFFCHKSSPLLATKRATTSMDKIGVIDSKRINLLATLFDPSLPDT